MKAKIFTFFGAFAAFAIVISLVLTLVLSSIPAFFRVAEVVTQNAPSLYGTFVVSSISMLISIPLSIGSSVFLCEYTTNVVRRVVSDLGDLMAAFPTVIYGFWGVYELGPFLKNGLFSFLHQKLGFIPLFSTPPLGGSYLLASIVLAIMVSPFSSSLIREVYLQVPASIDEAVYSTGLTKLEAIMVKLSYAKKGVLGALILAYGRAIGETVAVDLTVGGALNISPSVLSPGITVPAYIANQFGSAFTTAETSSFFLLALLLLAMGVTFLSISKWFLKEVKVVA